MVCGQALSAAECSHSQQFSAMQIIVTMVSLRTPMPEVTSQSRLDVEPSETVDNVKQRIETGVGFACDLVLIEPEVRVVTSDGSDRGAMPLGMSLDDCGSKTLAELGMREGSIVSACPVEEEVEGSQNRDEGHEEGEEGHEGTTGSQKKKEVTILGSTRWNFRLKKGLAWASDSVALLSLHAPICD